MKIVAIIPARSGSKGIPQKNLVDLGGKPLIAWSILAAQASNCIDRIIVSTDSDEIAEIATSYGAEVPFRRPKELATDNASGISVIIHSLEWLLINENYKADFVMVLQPTSPLRTTEDINTSIELLNEKGADSVVSIAMVKQHPYWMKTVDEKGILRTFCEETINSPLRQELPPVYILNGAIYLSRTEMVLQKGMISDDKTCAYIMPWERSIDIDDPLDLLIARHIVDKQN